jgi:HAD superfamily hydrolase (TIGR01509 family)
MFKYPELELKRYKALILDLDGVLVDSEPIYFEAYKALLKEYGFDLKAAYFDKMIGISTQQNLKDLADDFGLKLDIAIVDMQLEKLFLLSLKKMNVHASSEAWDLIRTAKEKGLLLGLCTSSSREIQVALLERIFDSQENPQTSRGVFDVVITGDDVKHKKPHPEPYQKITTTLNIYPSDCLVVEDSEAGIVSAKDAGCRCAAFRTRYNLEKNFSKADFIIHHLTELIGRYHPSISRGEKND